MLGKVKTLLKRDEVSAPTSEPDYTEFLAQISPGAAICFSGDAPAPLANSKARVIGLYSYVFDDTVVESFRLKSEEGNFFQLMVAADEIGHYIAVSRLIDTTELHRLMQRNGIVQGAQEALELPESLSDTAWFSTHYQTAISDMYGTLYMGQVSAEGAPRHRGRGLRYTLYTSEQENAAIEVEQYSDGTFQVMATLYRAVELLETIEPAPSNYEQPMEEVREYTPTLQAVPSLSEDAHTLAEWLDEPEAVQVGLPVPVAVGVLHDAFYSGQRLSDVLREQVGLDVLGKEEVGLTMHLSESDYKELARRYQLKASNKQAIHTKLQEEIMARYQGARING